jgi:RHS repeat-associated protein
LTYKQKFDFDRFGNMYRKAANNGTAGQTNPLPMTAIENSDISKATNRFTTNTTYNDAGMVIADNKFRSMNFSYDANGRQVNATNTGTSTTATTVYDALGNRVATKINDSWQFVIYDAFGKLVAEYGTQGEGNGGVSYVLQDWQGSVRASVNNNGFIQARFDFTAFGEEISLNVGLRSIEQGYSGDVTSRNGYGLTEKDSSGLNHTWFRKQEQKAGRWTSPDPYKGSMNLGNPQSFNRYSYVENDPTTYIDPSGLNYQIWRCQTSCIRNCDDEFGNGCGPWDCETRCELVMSGGGGVGPTPPGPTTGGDPGGGGSSTPVDVTLNSCTNQALGDFTRAESLAEQNRNSRIAIATFSAILTLLAASMAVSPPVAAGLAAAVFGVQAYGAFIDYGNATIKNEDDLVSKFSQCLGAAKGASKSRLALSKNQINNQLKPTTFRNVRDFILGRHIPLVPFPPRQF